MRGIAVRMPVSDETDVQDRITGASAVFEYELSTRVGARKTMTSRS